MNKNLNNQDGKGPQGGHIQNQGIKQNGTQPSEKGTNPNMEKDTNRADSWSKPNTDREKRIHPVEPSVEKNLNREREPQPMERGTNLNRDRDRLDSSTEKNLVREKEPIVMGSGTMQNKNAMDGSPSSRTQAMNNRGPVFKSPTFHAETPNQNLGSKLAEELKAPVVTGTALYVIAALLLIGWAVGFYYYNAGPAIHILLVLALVSVLIRVVQGRNY